jgi:hypothetical protein
MELSECFDAMMLPMIKVQDCGVDQSHVVLYA